MSGAIGRPSSSNLAIWFVAKSLFGNRFGGTMGLVCDEQVKIGVLEMQYVAVFFASS